MFKIVFAGTPLLAKEILATLIQLNSKQFCISLVLTQPDMKANRGHKITPTAVKELAIAHNIRVLTPLSLKCEQTTIATIKAMKPDIMVVAAYGLIIPKELLEIPRFGCVNLHFSILPRWRGAAPIQRAIIAGDQQTGVTLMQMDNGLDTGDILHQQFVTIAADDTNDTLQQKLIALSQSMIVDYLHYLYQQQTPSAFTINNSYANHSQYIPIAQNTIISNNAMLATYASKIHKKEAEINWHEQANIITRKIRAFNSSPGAFTTLDGVLVKIWQATPYGNCTHKQAIPATIVGYFDGALVVQCGNHEFIAIHTLQLASKHKQTAREFFTSYANRYKSTLTDQRFGI